MSACFEKRPAGGLLILAVLFFAPVFYGAAQTITLSSLETGAEAKPLAREPAERLFPALYFTDTLKTLNSMDAARPYWVDTEAGHRQSVQAGEDNLSILLNNDILAFYGHPLSKNMGILGRYSIEELDAKLGALAESYAAENGGRGIRKAFYIIYGTVWPQGEIGILKDDVLLRYIEYALEHDILVFIDHQIGRYDPVNALVRMLPYLRYPNVHLALDPEWRTTKPMMEIGTVSAEEINHVQQIMEDYIVEHQIPGERMLVIHQFNWRMIKNREKVNSGFNRVRLVHCADGFGSPHLKRSSYAYNAEASNMPIKGFKLFYNSGIPGAGYDNPLLSPREVYELNPRPYIIMYQ
ncbi:MAG: hypothetical protein LBL28_00205 [Treponema sp.]|jgi:hypothetical protein|nr:hypothetical protein [Treponema sp.]